MRVVIVGLGIQGKKRMAIAGQDCVATVDTNQNTAQYRTIDEVPLADYEAALVCTPDQAKLAVLHYLLGNSKHVLVEKPLLGNGVEDLLELQTLASNHGVVCYTAYNHRFEPHFVRLKQTLDANALGRIYSVRLFYGNGTARDVRNSVWRDQGCGVLPDLGSHLLDTILYWFGPIEGACRPWRADRFENRSYDRVAFGFHGQLQVDCEMSLLSWRNTFSADIYGENGSAHISCLCKWGPSTLTLRQRVLPSGRPDEQSSTLVCGDPTWEDEYRHFKQLCQAPAEDAGNLHNDIWIQGKLHELSAGLGSIQ